MNYCLNWFNFDFEWDNAFLMWLKKTFYKKWKWWFLCQRPRTSRGTVPSCWALVPVDLLMNQVIRLGVQLLKWWRKVILRSNKVKLEWIHSTDDSSDISYVKFWALKVIALIKDTKKLFGLKWPFLVENILPSVIHLRPICDHIEPALILYWPDHIVHRSHIFFDMILQIQHMILVGKSGDRILNMVWI